MRYVFFASTLLSSLVFCHEALAHGGGLDRYGCHNDRKRGGYHCHRSVSTPIPAVPAPRTTYRAPATPPSRTILIPSQSAAPPTQKVHGADLGLENCRLNAFTRPDEVNCFSDELEKQKALLNIQYKSLTRKTNETSREALDKAQRAWIEFRNAECESRISNVEGNVAENALYNCLIEHIKRRRAELEDYFVL